MPTRNTFVPIQAIIFSIIFTFSLTTNATQTKKRAGTKPAKPPLHGPAITKYVTTPFQSTIESLPPNYYGHDLAAIYNKVAQQVGVKGEFDTTAQYSSRIDSAITDEMYAFSIELGSLGAPLLKYDADKETLSMDILPLRFDRFDIANFNSDSRETLTGIPMKVEVTKNDEAIYCLATYNRNAWPLTISLKAKLAPEQARLVMKNIAPLFICKLKKSEIAPLVTFETLDSGKSSYVKKKCINVELLEIWLYDSKSGQIVKKQEIVYEPPFRAVAIDFDSKPKLVNTITRELLDPHKGSTILNKWRVEEVDATSVILINLQHGTRHTIITEFLDRRL